MKMMFGGRLLASVALFLPTPSLVRSASFFMTTPTRSPTTVAAVTPEASSSSRLEVSKKDSFLAPETTASNSSLLSFEDLCVPPNELRPSATLTTGQCFHWKVLSDSSSSSSSSSKKDAAKKESAWGVHDATEWIGTLRDPATKESIVVVLRQTPTTTLYRVLVAPEAFDARAFLWRYFQLAKPLAPLYAQWSESCQRLGRIAECIPGVRLVDQDPWECLISFICSSNNNIPRITKMLSAIRRVYGEPLFTLDDNEVLYSFPSHQMLLEKATEEDLRVKCGLGYRAKYVLETTKILDSLGGEDYLQKLRQIKDPVKVQEDLLQFCGVGRKVADCVALFSLQQEDAIPVDVHVWNIARRDYDKEGSLDNVKSLTPSTYRLVGDLFRQRFPTMSGWAHSLLFVGELPSFRPALPADLVAEMDAFREEEKRRKADTKKRKSSKGS